MFKNYLDNLSKLIFRPILFFATIPEGDWYEKPVTFAGVTTLILSILLTGVIFITQYLPIGATLLEKVNPSKYIIVSPVFFVLGCIFFIMTLILIFGALLALILGIYWFLAVLLYFSSKALGFAGDYLKDVKAMFFVSGTALVFALPILMIIMTKNRLMDFTNFVIGYNMLYSFWIIYLYGMFAIIARKEHGLPKSKAFVAAILPVLFLILVGILANKVILPKFQPWIM